MISDVIVATGRERSARVPISSVSQKLRSQHKPACSPSLPAFLRRRFPHITALPIPSILSTVLSSLTMPQNSALFPWPQLNPAQRIGLTCYVGLSMGADSSNLHEETASKLSHVPTWPPSLSLFCCPPTADSRPPISVSSPLTVT